MERKYSDMIRTSAKGSLILIFGQVISTAISALGTIIIARMLGATSFGIISIAQIPISIGLLLINASVSNAIVNFIAERSHEENVSEVRSIVYAGFIINIIIGVVTTFILYIFSGYISNHFFSRPETEPLIKILSLSIFAISLLNTGYAVLVGFEHMSQRNILSIIYSILKTTISPLLVLMGFGVVGVAYGTSMPYLIAGLIGCLLVYLNLKQLPASKINVNKYIGMIFVYSYPLFFSNLLTGGLNQFFNLILPLYVSDTMIGNYSAASNFSVLVLFLMTPLSTATFPLLSKLKPSDAVFEFVFQNLIKYEAILVFPIAFLTIALSNQIVLILYGTTYTYAPQFLRLLMINFIFIGLGSRVTTSLLSSQKMTKINLYSTLIYMVIGIPMGMLLIPRFGVIGYQATIIIAPKFGLLYNLVWIKKNYNLSLDYRVFIKTLISAFSSYIICIILQRYLVINPWLELSICSFLYLVSYVALVLLTGALSRQNIEDIYNMVSRNDKIGALVYPFYKILLRISR